MGLLFLLCRGSPACTADHQSLRIHTNNNTSTMYQRTTNTTENVRIIMLPSHSCGDTLQILYLKVLYSSTQTSADGLSGQLQVSCMTKKVTLGLPSECKKWRAGPSLWWQTVPCTCCSHRKGAVAKGSPTSRWHLQCRGVSKVETATSDDLWCRPQAVR